MCRGGTTHVIGVVRGVRVLGRRGEWVQDEHGVGLEVRAGPGQVGEGAVRSEAVVAVVVAHLERACGQYQALAGEESPEGLAAGSRPRSRLAAGGQSLGARAPARADEVSEGLVVGLSGPVGAARRQGLGNLTREGGRGGVVGPAVVCWGDRCHRRHHPTVDPLLVWRRERQDHRRGSALLVGREAHSHLTAGLLQCGDRRHRAAQWVKVGLACSGAHQTADLGQLVGELAAGLLRLALH